MKLQIHLENGESFIVPFSGSFSDAVNHFKDYPLYLDTKEVARKIVLHY